MATVTSFTAARMLDIENSTVVAGLVDVNGNLLLTKRDGGQINAGNVKGPKGDDARYAVPNVGSGTATYIRLGTLDGLSVSAGARLNFFLSGLGNYGSLKNATVLVHAQQRGIDSIGVSAWGYDLDMANAPITLYTRKLGQFLFEIWYKAPGFQSNVFLTNLSSWNATINNNGATTVMPSDLIVVPILSAAPVYATQAETDAGVIDNESVSPATLAPTLSDVKKFNKGFNLLRIPRDYPDEALDLDNLLQPAFIDYKNHTGLVIDEIYSQPRAFKTLNGWVTMRGLIVNPSALSVATVLFTLPVGWRPQYNMFFPSAFSDPVGQGAKGISVGSNGEVKLEVPAAAGTWLSLGSIFFNINPYNQPITPVSPYVAITNPWNVAPALYKSPDGLAHATGGVKSGVISSTAFTFPAGYQSPIANTEYHYGTVNVNGGYSYSNFSTVGNAYRPRITSDQYLSGLRWLTVGTSLKNYQAVLTNGWLHYGGAFPAVQATKTSDGLVMLTGLMRAGSVGATAFTLPPGYRPKRTIIMVSVSADAFANVYVTPAGDVQPVLGSASWFSLDGLVFAAEQ